MLTLGSFQASDGSSRLFPGSLSSFSVTGGNAGVGTASRVHCLLVDL
jgi:hypothetical protein